MSRPRIQRFELSKNAAHIAIQHSGLNRLSAPDLAIFWETVEKNARPQGKAKPEPMTVSDILEREG